MDRFNYTIHHIPGKKLYIADTLSCSLPSTDHEPSKEELAELLMEMHVAQLPASQQESLVDHYEYIYMYMYNINEYEYE